MQKENFLKETKYCDFKNQKIENLANDITRDTYSEKEKAVKLFLWVRDNIPYRFGSWSKKASEVLEQKGGMCTNKAVLLVSLLRSVGIHAGFGILRVKGQEYFGPIAIPMFKKRIAKESVHIYAYASIDNDWHRIDPSGDKELSAKTSHFNHTTELVSWDGSGDAMENISPETILKDEGPFYTIDKKLEKKPRNGKGLNIKMGNIYLEFLRESKVDIEDPKELQPLFIAWLKKNHIFYLLLFVVFSSYMDLRNKIKNI